MREVEETEYVNRLEVSPDQKKIVSVMGWRHRGFCGCYLCQSLEQETHAALKTIEPAETKMIGDSSAGIWFNVWRVP